MRAACLTGTKLEPMEGDPEQDRASGFLFSWTRWACKQE